MALGWLLFNICGRWFAMLPAPAIEANQFDPNWCCSVRLYVCTSAARMFGRSSLYTTNAVGAAGLPPVGLGKFTLMRLRLWIAGALMQLTAQSLFDEDFV